ncbi:TetR/AcrR family transcriptional regulator [Geodermatophilus amargosae]|uniref:TetR/AcrR family transcriptional regulator n=1 Tax=Geodermatophilus amargosae TaxID=1296565 RepID=UPI0034DF234D
MAQVLKQEVRARIEDAALRCFAEHGYPGTSIVTIATHAGVAPGNVYRYFRSKRLVFDAVVPADLPARHDRLLDTRIAALAAGSRYGEPADELLDFWLEHRLAVAVLLDRAEGTRFADYPAGFVQRLVAHALRDLDRPPSPEQHAVLELVFDNTRRALAHILRSARDPGHGRALVTGFWSYQLPGLDGLMAFLRQDSR